MRGKRAGPGHGHASFTLRKLPERVGGLPDDAILARGLGVEEAEIGVGKHRPAIYSAGNPFCCVPLRNREAVSRAGPQGEAFDRAFTVQTDDFTNAFVYCADPLDPAHAFHSRMFAPGVGVPEDPATGSAAAFAGLFVDIEKPSDGSHSFVIEQGDAMGRPSRITVSIDVAAAGYDRLGSGGGSDRQ